jgi:(1->4)-alpha-D-glucan 1-alpha-D-glucosylmutase
MEFQSLIAAFGRLPKCTLTEPALIHERIRDKEVHKRKLAEICGREEAIRSHIEEAVSIYNHSGNGSPGIEKLHDLLEAQPYRLASWKVASDEINYRRFFDVNNLAGLRMENPAVFEATHRLILQLVAAGDVNGLRIDHPDGLFDPGDYLRRLQARIAEVLGIPIGRISRDVDASRPIYLTLEKILAGYEYLPEDWPIHGTTGYEFGNLVNGLFVYGPAEKVIERTYSRFIGREVDFPALVIECRKLIIRTALASELNVLANMLDSISEADRRTRDYTTIALRDAIAEVVACFPVYRTYVTAQGGSEEDRRYVEWAVAQAKKRSPASDPSIFDLIKDVLLLKPVEGREVDYQEKIGRFAMRFQQYTAPVMAKGLEDTAFYHYNRLISLNEVGGDPTRFGVSVNALHQANLERARRWPHAMLCSSTHDSKRSADVRARINVISEIAEDWRHHLAIWSRLNRSRKRLVDDKRAPDRNDEYLLYQTLLGTWPPGVVEEQGLADYRDRIETYMIKAIREAKVHTSWINPNEEYEGAMRHFVRRLLSSPEKNRFIEDFLPFQEKISRYGMLNGLSQTLLKLTSPGVPDFYQGTVSWQYTLVDPDNRRSVDHEMLRGKWNELLAGLSAAEAGRTAFTRGLLDTLEDGKAKQFLITRTLALRRELDEVFRDGTYVPLSADGKRADHLFAFARRHENETVLMVAPRWFARLCPDRETLPLGPTIWSETWIALPEDVGGERFINVLTDEYVSRVGRDGGWALEVDQVLANFPVALLRASGSV